MTRRPVGPILTVSDALDHLRWYAADARRVRRYAAACARVAGEVADLIEDRERCHRDSLDAAARLLRDAGERVREAQGRPE